MPNQRADYLPKLPIPVSQAGTMDSQFEERRRKNFTVMRMIYDLTMAVIFLGIAVMMLFAQQLRLDRFISVDDYLRYIFGAICVLYGGFRLYRGIKRNY